MSIKVMTEVWANSAAEGTALLMMLAIADFADDEGYAYPGIGTLAKKCRVSRRSIQRSIKHCQEIKELGVAQNKGIKTGHGSTNLYRIFLPNLGVTKCRPLNNDDKMSPQALTEIPLLDTTDMAHEPSVEPSEETLEEPPSQKDTPQDYLEHIVQAQANGVKTDGSSMTVPSVEDQFMKPRKPIPIIKFYQEHAGGKIHSTQANELRDLAAHPDFDWELFQEWVPEYEPEYTMFNIELMAAEFLEYVEFSVRKKCQEARARGWEILNQGDHPGVRLVPHEDYNGINFYFWVDSNRQLTEAEVMKIGGYGG